MKRFLCAFIVLIMAASACAELTVVCSIFPQYDFARIIGGDKINVSQLLPAGMDSHEFEASARDVLSADRADLLIYTDDELEQWISTIKGSFTHVKPVRCAEGIDLEELNEIWEHEFELGEDGHSHDHEHAYDAHIWLDPSLALVMAQNIAAALIESDPENTEYYTANLASLQSDLLSLDAKFRALFDDNPDCTLYFGGKFAYSHFIRHYGLNYVSAYSGCSDEGEPGARTIVRMIRGMRENNAPVIFTDELSSGEVSRAIAAETGAEILLFHTCHNVSKAENGLTYLEIMEMNYENISRALTYGE